MIESNKKIEVKGAAVFELFMTFTMSAVEFALLNTKSNNLADLIEQFKD